jgi:hypothetical protein
VSEDTFAHLHQFIWLLTSDLSVVGRGIDPRTSRFSDKTQ